MSQEMTVMAVLVSFLSLWQIRKRNYLKGGRSYFGFISFIQSMVLGAFAVGLWWHRTSWRRGYCETEMLTSWWTRSRHDSAHAWYPSQLCPHFFNQASPLTSNYESINGLIQCDWINSNHFPEPQQQATQPLWHESLGVIWDWNNNSWLLYELRFQLRKM
jgi:hypothetical protein